MLHLPLQFREHSRRLLEAIWTALASIKSTSDNNRFCVVSFLRLQTSLSRKASSRKSLKLQCEANSTSSTRSSNTDSSAVYKTETSAITEFDASNRIHLCGASSLLNLLLQSYLTIHCSGK